MPLHQGNGSLSCLYFNWQILSRFRCLWCCQYGCISHTFGETIATRRWCYPSRQEEYLHVHLEGQEYRYKAYSTCSKAGKRREAKVHNHMQTRRVLGGIKREKQRFALVVKEEVAPSIEIPEKMKPMLEEFKRVVYDELPEGLPPMRDI